MLGGMAAPLASCRVGETVVFQTLDGHPGVTQRLAEMGLRHGMRLSVLQHTTGGGRVLAAGEVRIAIDRRLAEALLVDPVDAA